MCTIKRVGRNYPCPCGSGKSYGQCCGATARIVSLTQARWRKTGQQLRRKLGEFADRPSLAREAARAQELYLDCLEPELADSDDEFIMERCFEWFIFDYMLPSGRTVIQVFRDTPGLAEDEKVLLLDWISARVSLYEVLRVFPGKSLVIRNLIDQEEITVQDASAAEDIDTDSLLLIRVLKVGDEYEFSTSGLVLPKLCKGVLLKKLHYDLRAFCRQRGIAPREGWSIYLRDRAHQINAWVTELGITCTTPHLVEDENHLFNELLQDNDVQSPFVEKISARIAQKITDAYLDDYYDKWIDKPISALGNKTPRQACRTAAGRLKVEELLKELERMEAERVRNGETHYDILKVRLKLGLTAEPQLIKNNKIEEFAGNSIDALNWPEPLYLDVARQVEQGLKAEGYSQKQVEGAVRLWNDYCHRVHPSFRKSAVWVATVIYAMARMELNETVNQHELANQYGVAPSSISTNFRSLCRNLELVAFDRRYSAKKSPLEGLKDSDPILAQLLENLKL